LVVRIAAPGCATYTRKEMGINWLGKTSSSR
jgi:hypothetical protein